MKDKYKTRRQLIEELEELRQQLFKVKESRDKSKQIEERLRSSEKRLELIGRVAYDVLYELTIANDTLEWLSNSDEILGYEHNTIPRTIEGWLELVHPEDAVLLRAAVKQHKTSTEPVSYEYRVKHKDGTWRYWSDRGLPINNEDGSLSKWVGVCTDITHQRQAELIIKQVKEKYETLIQNIPDALYAVLLDETRTITFMSPRWRDWTGYTPEDFYSDPTLWPMCIHPEDRDKAVRAFTEAMKRKREYIIEYRVVHKETGKVLFLNDHGIPIKAGTGNITRIDGIVTDVTRRKQLETALNESYQGLEEKVEKRTAELSFANKQLRREIARRKESEEKLIESEERYRQLIETANDAIFMADADTGIIVDANKKAEELLGKPLEKIIGMHQTQFHSEEDTDYYGRVFKESVQRGKGDIIKDVIVCHKNGQKIPTEVSASVIKFKGKNIIQGIFRDITERKKAEKEIKEGKEFLESVIENSGDGIAIVDEKGYILSVNTSLIKMCTFSKEELLGKHISILTVGDKDLRKKILEKSGELFEKGFASYESKHKAREGGYLNVECNSTMIKDGRGNYIAGVAILRDITDRKRAEESLRKSEEKLVHNQEQLRSLASQLTTVEEQERRNIASYLHDHLGQELFALKLQLEQLKASLPFNDTITTLESIIERTNQMMSDMRSMSYELSPPILYELNLEAALEWIVEKMRPLHAVTITFNDDGQAKPLDETTKVLLFQAVRELLNNVTRHAKAQTVEIFVERDNAMVVIRVNDDGIGFENSAIAASREKNQGFGLYSIKERLKYIGGAFDVESALNRGARITLKAPLKS